MRPNGGWGYLTVILPGKQHVPAAMEAAVTSFLFCSVAVQRLRRSIIPRGRYSTVRHLPADWEDFNFQPALSLVGLLLWAEDQEEVKVDEKRWHVATR